MSPNLPKLIAAYFAAQNRHGASVRHLPRQPVDLRYAFTLAGERIARLEIV